MRSQFSTDPRRDLGAHMLDLACRASTTIAALLLAIVVLSNSAAAVLP